jgi:hypothetical protein
LTATDTDTADQAESTRQELLARLGWAALPEQLAELRPLERAELMVTLQETSPEDYPTALLESLTTIDDCLHYMAVKRDRP